VVSAVLRGGVLLSGGVIFLGLVLFFIQNHSTNLNDITKVPFSYQPGTIFGQIAHGSGTAIILLGLMLLILTPVSRIAVSTITFAVERDWRYVAITALVLLILLVSFALGKAG
jgi:uncharacterized membrane protein